MKAARLLLVLVAACGLGQSDRERIGDLAWHEARWSDAITQYRAAGDGPRLLAKLADAELQSGLLAESADSWTRLGMAAPDRADEAAAGLARVATMAEHDGKQAALAAAILGIRRVAPGWPLGRIAGRLGAIPAGLEPGQLADLVPALLAGTMARVEADPMLLRLGQADRARGACDVAVPLLEGVLRRTTMAGLRDTATTSIGWCELTLGLTALQGGHPGDAERWLDRAARRDPQGAVGRRALIGFGDARARQGDSAAARLAWRAVAMTSDAAPDTVTQLALLRLTELPPSVVTDSLIPHPVRP